MKFTNRELVEIQQAFTKLIQVKLPVKVSLDIAIVTNTIDTQVRAFAKVRDNLMQNYHIRTEQVGESELFRFICKDKEHEKENLTAFQKEFNELMEAETEDLTFKKIRLPAEVDGKAIQIEPSTLMPLVKLIEIT